MNVFVRSKLNPILKPNLDNEWESLKVYNPGAIYEDGKYHLFYRAMGSSWNSTLGYAISYDGEDFKRQDVSLLKSENNDYSIEDPRIAKVGDTYYLTYTRYDGLNVTLDLAILCHTSQY